MEKLVKLLSFGALVLGSSVAHAHDFFLMPEQFEAPTGGGQTIRATVGSSFPAPDTAVPADRVEQLYARGSGSPRLRVGSASSTALNLQLIDAGPGALVAAVAVKPREVDYAEDRIPLILEEYRVSPEALAAVEALARPRTLQVLSRRFAKTLFCIRTCGRDQADRPFGVHLEFVALDPGRRHFRLLSEGRGLGNYPVDLVTADGNRRHLQTDPSGDVHVPNDARGSMMFFAAVMQPPAQSGRFTLDLSTLTFDPAEAAPASGEADRSTELTAVTQVLSDYRSAIERLDASGTERLFTADSQVFENGGVEGTYANYLAHHLGPELGHFRAFQFSDVNVDVRFEGPVALATETYSYRIERQEGDPIERRGVTTSVLRREGSQWRIVSMHGSSRAPRPPAQ